MLAAAFALVGVLGSPALAQGIPDAIRTKTEQLSADEANQVKQYVTDNSKNLMSGDPQLMKKDRDALLEPLQKGDTGVSFRIACERELLPKIQQMVASKEDLIAVNGLILAGDLATTGAVGVIETKIGDKAAAVRFQAGFALARTFQAFRTGQPAVDEATLKNALTDLQGRISQERNTRVLDSFIRAGLAAAESEKLRAKAVTVVARGVIDAAKNLNDPATAKEDADALLRAAVEVRNIMGDLVQKNTAFDPESATNAAEMAGVLISRINQMVEQKQLPGLDGKDGKPLPLREACGSGSDGRGEGDPVGGPTVLQPGAEFPDCWTLRATADRPWQGSSPRAARTGDGKFSTLDVDAIIGQGGILSKPPFKISPDKLK